MPPLTKSRWEIFAQNVFSGKTALESAAIAKYSPKSLTNTSSVLLDNPRIQARIEELHEAAASKAVMTVQERMERLSEIARAKLTDLMELGKDGSWVNLGPETVGGAAIQEIHSRTEYDENGEHPTVYTSVKLHSPLTAIDILNKMTPGAYAPVKSEITGKDGDPIEFDVRSKVLCVLANGASRIRAEADSQPALPAGVGKLELLGEAEPTTA